MEKIQGGRYDELQMHKVLYGGIDCDIGCDELNVKKVLQDNVGERDLGLNELSQAKSRGGAELGKDTRRTV